MQISLYFSLSQSRARCCQAAERDTSVTTANARTAEHTVTAQGGGGRVGDVLVLARKAGTEGAAGAQLPVTGQCVRQAAFFILLSLVAAAAQQKTGPHNVTRDQRREAKPEPAKEVVIEAGSGGPAGQLDLLTLELETETSDFARQTEGTDSLQAPGLMADSHSARWPEICI
ncbi:hypothetical protein SKAU_G00337530 [Synaphobranchus kaupii]|uniref:Uncharacterized protein n=1 Tax=Synaphobranchus kaupii TaxID=118154 RepID=A0A9Q1IIV3_SYNKA|nr:hypothetical protein SKAU_G00337530 [Synaphobranchus kaupii]